MDEFQALSHTSCAISSRHHPEVPQEDAVRRAPPHLGEVFHKLAMENESKFLEGHLIPITCTR